MRNHLTPACSGAKLLVRFVPILLLLLLLTACGGSSAQPRVVITGPPSISSLNPTQGGFGAPVTISGTNFGFNTGSVTFNGTTASTPNWTDTSIVAKVPLGATTGNVVVTVNGSASNGINFTVVTIPPGTIANDYFGMQCGAGTEPGTTNCPNEPGTNTPTWPTSVAQPGLLRLWDSEVSWSYLMTNYSGGTGTYSWAQLDGFLDDIAANGPIEVNYTFGCVPSFATSGPSGTTPGSCGPNGSASPPNDLGPGGSPTFTQFVTDLINHCSPNQNCVKDLITGYELWNEANVSSAMSNYPRWNGTQTQLYQMVAPAVAYINTHVSNPKIYTPSITGGGGQWMTGWLNAEIAGGIISNRYNFHTYLNNDTPEDVLEGEVVSELAPNTSTNGWTPLPWVVGESSWDDIALPYGCNDGNTGTQFTTTDCIGQMVRWDILLSSTGGSGLYWYYWNTNIGSQSSYAQAYFYMMQYLVGGKLNSACQSSGNTPAVYTCSFTEAGGTGAQWVWESCPNDNNYSSCVAGTSYSVPAGYVDYKDLKGGTTNVSGGQNITVTVQPILLEK